MADVPPWLDFTPQTFAGAAEAGRRLNQGEEQLDIERGRLAQEASAQMAQHQMEQQRLALADRQGQMENQLRQQQIASNFQRAQTQAAIAQAYHEAQIGLGKERLETENTRLNQSKIVKVGNDAYQYDPTSGQMTKVVSGPVPTKGQLTVTAPFTNPNDPLGTAGTIRGTPAQVAGLMGTNAPAFLQQAVQPAATGQTPTQTPPQPGDVIDGFRYKGGDPSQQTNWEASATSQ